MSLRTRFHVNCDRCLKSTSRVVNEEDGSYGPKCNCGGTFRRMSLQADRRHAKAKAELEGRA